jgi:acyl-CoA synthetase (AMP-forming)/AMP-acid ligase II
MPLQLLQQLSDRPPDDVAIHEPAQGSNPSRDVTHAQLLAAVRSTTATLRSDLRPGDVLLLVSPNRAEFTAAFLGGLGAGMKVFPLSPELADVELLAAAEQVCPAAVIGIVEAVETLRGRVRHAFSIEELLTQSSTESLAFDGTGAAGLLLQSSGTTGRPKVIHRDAASLDAVARQMAEAIGFRSDDRVLACVPLCHSYGIEHGLLAPTWAGSTVHLARGFDLRVARRELVDAGITILPGVPFMFEMLAQHGGDATFSTLRRAYSAGGPLPPSVYDAFLSTRGVRVSQLYGATEIGSVTFSDPDLSGFEPASVGRAMRGVDIRILDVDRPKVDQPLPPGEQGQVAVRAQSMLREYLGEEHSPTLNGFFLTGDLGRVDEHGNLFVTGRLKLLIDVGGLKVNPLEVEGVLAQHDAVGACVVVPMRVSETVCRLKAIVTPADPDAPPSPDALRQFARARLASYKVPRVFELRETLPTSPTGKVLRHLVEAEAAVAKAEG